MKIVLASRNKHKIEEWNAMIGKYAEDVEILSLDEVGITEDVEENGTTFEENAYIKAYAAAKSGYVSVGEDSGLSVDALNGAPGIYSARYAGDHGNDRANNALLLKNMEGVANRTARFVCTIALVDPTDPSRNFSVRGEAVGQLLTEYRGEGGFGYDPLFFDPKAQKTFGEMSAEEKNAVSHRRIAIELLAKKIKEYQTR